GKLVAGVFRADDQGINPDTLERDHAMLMVNRQDDAFAKKRTQNVNVDEAKCKRTQPLSSTPGRFPPRPPLKSMISETRSGEWARFVPSNLSPPRRDQYAAGSSPAAGRGVMACRIG